MQQAAAALSPVTSCRLGLERGAVYTRQRRKARPHRAERALLRPAPGELLTHALRAAPHGNHLDAAYPDLPDRQLAREAGPVELRQDPVHGTPGSRVAEAVGDRQAPG